MLFFSENILSLFLMLAKMQLVFLWLCFSFFSCENPKELKAIPDLYKVKLATMSGDSLALSEVKNDTASVFIFLSPDCPIAQKYTLKLEEMSQNFSAKGCKFYGVFNDQLGQKKTALTFQEKYKMSFPILKDEQNELKGFFAASISPEVFVINPKKEILYQGMIDNWFFALGKKRKVISKHYLRDALEAVAAKEPVRVTATEAVGCYLP